MTENFTHLKTGDGQVAQMGNWRDEIAVEPMHAKCSSNGREVVVHVRNMYAKGVRIIRER